MCFRPAEIQMKPCPECGKQNPPIAKTCSECGADLGAGSNSNGANMGIPDIPSMAPNAPSAPSAPGAPTVPGASK